MNIKNKSVFFTDSSNESNFIVHKDTDNVYVNVFIPNTTNDVIPAEYVVQQSKPILSNVNDYEAGIVRMKIPTTSIPLMIFEDNQYFLGFVIGQNDTDLLSAPITLLNEYKSNDYQFSPSNKYIYNYSQFLGCVNKVLYDLWVLATLHDANYQAIIPATLHNARFAPYFEINGTTPYLNFIAPVDENEAVLPSCPFNENGIQLIMSNKLFYFFSGFPSKYYSNGQIAGNTNFRYKLQLYGNKFNNTKEIKEWNNQAAFQACVITQDAPSLNLWHTLTRVFITSSILLEKEYVLVRGSLEGVPKKFEILTDFELPYDSSDKDLRENIYIQPSTIRWMNFKSGGNLDKMDLKIYFQTKDLTVFPLMIPTGFEVTMKMRFRRRINRELKQHTNEKQLVSK